jgi:excisionase family DNA binding protein
MQDFLTTKEAAAFLRCTESALIKFRVERRGPPFLRVGRLVRYRQSDLVDWIEGSRVVPCGAVSASKQTRRRDSGRSIARPKHVTEVG